MYAFIWKANTHKLDISVPKNSKLVNERKVRKKDAATKSKIKENVDKIRKSKYSDVKVDDLVPYFKKNTC